jgi:hypothetical protein
VRATAGTVTSAVLLVLLAAATLVAVTPGKAAAAARKAAATVNPSQLFWLIKSNDLAELDQQAASDAVTLPTFTWVGCGGQSDIFNCLNGQVPIFTSYWALAARARAGWQGTAVFDIEPWSFTPLNQRKDPDKWICMAARLQQRDPNLKVIITPFGRPANSVMIPEDAEAAMCGAYAVDVQSQFANSQPARFAPFIRAAVRAIRSVNPKTEILAGLATNSPTLVTAADMTTDYYSALAAGVQGFWLNANNWFGGNECTAAQGGYGCPQTAIEFLENIGMITGGEPGSTPTPSPTASTPAPGPTARPGQSSGNEPGEAVQGNFVGLVLDNPLARLSRLVGVIAVIAACGCNAWFAGDLVLGDVKR